MANENSEKKLGIHEEEKQKIVFLENLVKYMYNTKLQIDSDNKVIGVSFTPDELKTLVEIEGELMEMKRKIYGMWHK